MRNKKKIPDSEKEKTALIIFSIVIALLLWAYVIGQVNPTTRQVISNVPVQLLNVQSLTARDLAIAGNSEYMVDVVVEGKRSDIMKVSQEEIIAEADLFGWSKGENFIPVNVKAPDILHIVEVKSAKIQVTIEDLVALSKPVVLIYKGTMPENTEEGAIEIKPEAIEVTGAKSDVESVTQIQATIDIGDLSAEGENVQAEVIPVNYAGMTVENVKLSANYVDVFARLCRLKEVALIVEVVGSLEEGYGAETNVPEKILIKGSKNALRDIEAVYTEPVDISGMTADGTIDLSIVLPEGVELAKGYEKIQAGISIVEVSTRTFRYSSEEILLEGLTTGKSVTMEDVPFEITVSGRKEIVNKLTEDQIKLYIDVTDAPEGSQTAKIRINSAVPLQKMVVAPDEIAITVKNTE